MSDDPKTGQLEQPPLKGPYQEQPPNRGQVIAEFETNELARQQELIDAYNQDRERVQRTEKRRRAGNGGMARGIDFDPFDVRSGAGHQIS